MLNDTTLKKILKKNREKLARIPDRDGLYIRVSTRGKVVFYIRYRIGGKQDSMDLGEYPLLSLKEARNRNEEYRALLQDGHNPKVEKRLRQKKISDAVTLKELFYLWYEKECKVTIKNHIATARRFEYNLSKMADLPVDKISTHDWLDVLEVIARRTPSTSGVILSELRKMYALGVRRRILTDNPLLGVTAKRDLHVTSKEGERNLDNNELRLLFHFINNGERFSERNKLFLVLCLHFGCRPSELRLAKKEHFDLELKVWTVPAENHKTGRKTKKPLVRPIIDEVIPTIKEISRMSDNETDFITNSGTGEQYNGVFWNGFAARINDWLKRNDCEQIDSWPVYALRKTMRTNISDLTQPHVAEIMLGHKLPGVWGVYDKHQYLNEQREAYVAWWYKLERILAGSENVVEINRA
ncbi:integrase family protein [Photobacterium frigidiphilum]|uniref:tyrosine-type recombinase/integrase n=1 Tax=Photobacterium frigidiphilum TaxID=264736 RepID=UPI003D099EF6